MRIRVEVRDGLRADFTAASEYRDRVQLADAIVDQLAGIRTLLQPQARKSDDDDDLSACDATLESYFGKMVAVNAIAEATSNEGIPLEAEQAGALGDRVIPAGLH